MVIIPISVFKFEIKQGLKIMVIFFFFIKELFDQ